MLPGWKRAQRRTGGAIKVLAIRVLTVLNSLVLLGLFSPDDSGGCFLATVDIPASELLVSRSGGPWPIQHLSGQLRILAFPRRRTIFPLSSSCVWPL